MGEIKECEEEGTISFGYTERTCEGGKVENGDVEGETLKQVCGC